MTTLEHFETLTCPRCKQSRLEPIGEGQLALRQSFAGEGAKASEVCELAYYAKACQYCGYVELFSKSLVEGFKKERSQTVGQILQTPDGQRLLSLPQSYLHRGVLASDFTIPISSQDWARLKASLASLSDDALTQAVMSEPYARAWRDRIGAIPEDFGKKLRQLIEHHLDSEGQAEHGKWRALLEGALVQQTNVAIDSAIEVEFARPDSSATRQPARIDGVTRVARIAEDTFVLAIPFAGVLGITLVTIPFSQTEEIWLAEDGYLHVILKRRIVRTERMTSLR